MVTIVDGNDAVSGPRRPGAVPPRAGEDTAPPPPGLEDAESREWLQCLHAGAGVRDEALERLHALLLRAARFEAARREATLPLDRDELEKIACDAADDAMTSLLARLDEFRGTSRFTTWAYKFALLEAAVKLRRRAFEAREPARPPDAWTVVPSSPLGPGDTTEQAELLATLQHAIATVLTPHQRRVLTALALEGVPIDLLAERLSTTRGALYATLHDARRVLRRYLTQTGPAPRVEADA